MKTSNEWADEASSEWDFHEINEISGLGADFGNWLKDFAECVQNDATDGIDWGRFAVDVIVGDSAVARFQYATMAADWAREHYPERYTLRAVPAKLTRATGEV